jgi:hypothetical protein
MQHPLMIRRKTDNRQNGLAAQQNKGKCCSNTVHTSAFAPNVAVTLHRHSLVWMWIYNWAYLRTENSVQDVTNIVFA